MSLVLDVIVNFYVTEVGGMILVGGIFHCAWLLSVYPSLDFLFM